MEPSCFIVPFGHEIAIAKFIFFCLRLVDEGFIYQENALFK